MNQSFDVIVVGGGHSGIEASHVCARMGFKTLLATNNLDRIGHMSCNPSIGGLGKGHIVKEIDALGGLMGQAADANCIQFKRLNSRKGPAVRGSRAQCDKDLYSQYMAKATRNQKNLNLVKLEIESLIIEKNQCVGVKSLCDQKIYAKAVIITTGTFMRAILHFGLKQMAGGRVGDKATIGISDQLIDFGFNVTRLKTGTPPRLDKNSINWDELEAQGGDKKFIPFSYKSTNELSLPQIYCHLTYTNEQTHEIIKKNLDQSPMYCGVIEGIGPRYCPSIEDKITRFADKPRHQSFLEPEGLSTDSIYLQGISTSLPIEVQYDFLKTMKGLERVKILQAGYAVEYDFIEPDQIWKTLETKPIKNLFLAGQINGTSGYEEAAGQGLLAGINAGLKILEKEELILERHESYIGVLIDDLVTKGTKEPYRMMTSRAEHRLVLREDNVLDRLSAIGHRVGSLGNADFLNISRLLEKRKKLFESLENFKISPTPATQDKLLKLPTAVLQKPISLRDLLRRNEVTCSHLKGFGFEYEDDEKVYEPVEIAIKYQGYIDRQNELIKQTKRLEQMKLTSDICYAEVKGLSAEEVEKLSKIQPVSLGQAGRISGVNPSAIQALIVYLKGRGKSFKDMRA